MRGMWSSTTAALMNEWHRGMSYGWSSTRRVIANRLAGDPHW